jgi:hypothetical protein
MTILMSRGGVLALAMILAGLTTAIEPTPTVRAQVASGAAAASLPGTPVGLQMQGLLEAFNSGSLDTILRFVRAHYAKSALTQRPAMDRALALAEIYSDMHGFDVRQVDQVSVCASLTARRTRERPDDAHSHDGAGGSGRSE